MPKNVLLEDFKPYPKWQCICFLLSSTRYLQWTQPSISLLLTSTNNTHVETCVSFFILPRVGLELTVPLTCFLNLANCLTSRSLFSTKKVEMKMGCPKGLMQLGRKGGGRRVEKQLLWTIFHVSGTFGHPDIHYFWASVLFQSETKILSPAF